MPLARKVETATLARVSKVKVHAAQHEASLLDGHRARPCFALGSNLGVSRLFGLQMLSRWKWPMRFTRSFAFSYTSVRRWGCLGLSRIPQTLSCGSCPASRLSLTATLLLTARLVPLAPPAARKPLFSATSPPLLAWPGCARVVSHMRRGVPTPRVVFTQPTRRHTQSSSAVLCAMFSISFLHRYSSLSGLASLSWPAPLGPCHHCRSRVGTRAW